MTIEITRDNVVDFIGDIFLRRGAESYMGEAVTMSQHMLQTAMLAEEDQAEDHEVAAGLLHDIGHYCNEIPESLLMQGTDNHHEAAGADFLSAFFPDAMTDPIRHHVAAKRYLCAVDTTYLKTLSEASVYTLQVQGGPMSDKEAVVFAATPYLDACLNLRIRDDRGKDPSREHPSFDHYRPLLQSLLKD